MKNSIKIIILSASVLLVAALSTLVSAQDEYPYGDLATGGLLFGLGLLCLIPIIMLIIGIIIAIWVYKDAEKRGSSGALWLIIVILTSIIGLIIWLVVRPPIGGEKGKGSNRNCPNCGRGIPEDARVCPYCNKKFDEQ